MHNIAIVGGNMAGAATAHYLLRHVLPLLNPPKGEKAEYKVTLVSPSSHTYFKIAAPRALRLSANGFADKVFASIPDGFSQYDSSLFTFVQGQAVQVDESTQTISVTLTNDRDAGASKVPTTVSYDSLIIATGTTSNSSLWTLHGTHDKTATALATLRNNLPSASSILIAGGGPAGVETAGEIGSTFSAPGKEITLLSGGDRLLPRLKHATVHQLAEKKLLSVGVKTIHQLRVTSSSLAPNGQTIVKLSDGSTKTVDLFIDATGGVPNTSFLPALWLDEHRRVAADVNTLRATKAPAGVYAIGDVASFSKGGVLDATWSVAALGYSVWEDLSADQKERRKGKGMKPKTYKQLQSDMGIVPIGPKGGVGVIFGWGVPSWFVWLLKARDFMIGKAAGIASGEGI